ncbi:MAG: hypothetical protein ABI332_00245 [Polyangiaceae bacterium]
MPTAAKLVTIVTVFGGQTAVEGALASLGVGGYTRSKGKGTGAHGVRPASVFEADNAIFTIVTTNATAAKILEWVERELIPHHPSIAYCADVVAVLQH